MHAALDFTFEHPAVARQWHQESNTLVVLAVPDEHALADLIADIDCGDWRYRRTKPDGSPYLFTAFHEPDLDDALTAVAIEPDGHHLVRKLPLALSERSSERVLTTTTPGGES